MEKIEAVRCFNEGKHFVETCLEQIASLEQNNDKELRQVLRGTDMVEISYKAAENFVKVCGYVINGEDDAQIFKGKLYDLKEKVRQLYNSADKQNLITIKDICDVILKEIGEVEEWANDNESDDGDKPPVTKTNQPDIIPEIDDNECPNIGEDSRDKGKSKPMTTDEIIQSLEGKEAFEPLKTINLYGVYYDRLVKGKITDENGESKVLGIIRKVCDDDKENIKLLKHCVERADISSIVVTGRKSYAMLFMNDIADSFKEPEKFRKAAAMSFKVKWVGGVGGNYKKNYRLLMKELFSDDADYRKRKKKVGI